MKKIITVLGLLALMFLPNKALAKTSVIQSQVVAENNKPITRTEVFVNKLPNNSNLYGVREQKGSNVFSKLRFQSLPISLGDFNLGLVSQYTKVTNSPEHAENGLVLRYVDPGQNSLFKSEFRYLPTENTLDTYTFLKARKMFYDVLGAINVKTNKGFIKPGIDYQISDKTSVGVETKLSGDFSDLNHKYTGFKIKRKF